MIDDKVVLVTGAGRGIGSAVARSAAEAGAKVVINYNRGEAEKLASELRSKGHNTEILKADVSVEAEVQATFKFVRERFGRLDVLVNNAGVVGNNLLLMTSTEELDRIIAVNCRGSFLCLRAAAKMMMRQRAGRKIKPATGSRYPAR